ncbi:hypothetical protein [Gemella sp. zg-1178]|uniref:hypothetical protein n=1 Tax=Gemella sp. zg-1178 TaxID=2840372 RepID=UPI001C05E57B|nr:hypothetical protein [Gemella sp. zg-1178]MBU0279281.1 hypothetical protein [Gemella sp. zg-1178]
MSSRVNSYLIFCLLAKPQLLERELYLFLNSKEKSDCELGLRPVLSSSYDEALVRKISNRDYLFKKGCLDCVNRLFDEMDLFTNSIVSMRFKKGYSIQQICFKVSYSKSSVYNIIKGQKDKLYNMLLDLEADIYGK